MIALYPARPASFTPRPLPCLPLLDAKAVRAMIGAHFEYSIADLQDDVEFDRFEWVFDISATLGFARRHLRFFKPSVENRLKRLLDPAWRPPPVSVEEVMASMFVRSDPPREWLTTPEVQTALMCDHKHVLRLLRRKSLRAHRQEDIRAGRDGGARITCYSMWRFLRDRKV